jgi:hypothetical protein
MKVILSKKVSQYLISGYVTVTKAACYQHKNKRVDELNRMGIQK